MYILIEREREYCFKDELSGVTLYKYTYFTTSLILCRTSGNPGSGPRPRASQKKAFGKSFSTKIHLRGAYKSRSA